ncbi:MAG: hypothetical protein IJL74_04170 [Bacilli bacterium]|nr:hypothetical protein [Bacilli bacterium]
MKKITKLLILAALMFIPVMANATGNITIEHKSYNKTTHVFHVDGDAPGKYAIVTLYDGSTQLAMYVANVNNGTYSADIKITFKEAKTITIKVGDINGTTYAKATLDVEKSVNDISKATISGIVKQTYNGKQQRQDKLVVKMGTKTLKKDTDYTVGYSSLINAGTITMTIKGKGNYEGSVKKTFTRAKAKNTLSLKYANKTVYYSKVKKSSQVVKPITILKKQGTLTYTKMSGSSAKLLLNKTTGKVTVKKGTKKGKYKIRIKVYASGNSNYLSNYTIKTIYVTVK